MRTGSLLLLSLLGLAPLASYAQVVARLTPTSPDYLDDFSAAVALTEADGGTWALVGAPGDNDATGDAGSVFAYYRPDGGAWELQAQIFAPGEPLFEGGFGSAIALSGRLAVVAETGWAARERAYVLRREGEGMGSVWVVEAVLEPKALADPSHLFGIAVALDTSAEAEAAGGAVAVVGAAPRETLGPSAGAAHVFRRVVAGEWEEEAVLRANEGDVIDRFGQAISAANGRISVGATEEALKAFPVVGAVYIYANIGDNHWEEEVRLDDENAPSFGYSIGISERNLFVGAPNDDCPGPIGYQCGAALAYRWQQDGTWELDQRLELTDPIETDFFGGRIALIGERALVTAPGRTGGGIRKAGAAYLYSLENGAWEQMAELLAPEPSPYDRLGLSAALSETAALVGTDETLGAAYVFDLAIILPNETTGPQPAELIASVYPNPTVGLATLSFQLSEPAEVHVEVFDTLGRAVWRRTARVGAGTHSMQPEIAGTGLYHVRLRTSTGETVTTTLLCLGR